ncbi:MAG: glycosyltransferase family 2 protein [Lachnospiraceae bacterium]|nr:glycosyltransferase family 2 protein [Lachnospiraceae bacterium]
MKLNAVILNYNDADTVRKQLAVLAEYKVLEQIVVVDNCSTDDSFRWLSDAYGAVSQSADRAGDRAANKVIIISAEKNGGYGSGNNLGVRYAVEHNQATHVLILNPDVMVSELCIHRLLRLFANHPDAGIVTAKMQDQQYGDLRNGWPLRGFTRELLSMGPVSRRLFRSFLEYPARYFREKQAVYVDAVHGSMLMVDAEKFLEAGGYDEGIFLYQEEAVLAWRMKTSGYRTILLLTDHYDHEHSASISKSFAGQLQRQRLREESTLYYMKQYLFINRFQERIANAWFAGIRLEIRAASLIK